MQVTALRRWSPLLGDAGLDLPAVICADRTWSWREVHAASIVFAEEIGPASAVCNLCDSRIGFLVVWLAALRRGLLQVLPPSGGRADLNAMLESIPGACVVVYDTAPTSPELQAARSLVWQPIPASRPRTANVMAWSPDFAAPLVRLHTSGSTGRPEPQVKTLGQLVRGAGLLGARLEELPGGVAVLRALACSVPPQHMFGLETSVMLSLVYGVPVMDGRPLLPADIRASLESCPDGSAWITTPLHMRSLQRSGESLPHCRVVIASTMPLARSLAADVEALVAPVLEIYGSTETGAVATRRTAREARWRPLAEVRFEPAEDHTRVWGPHFPSPQTLADRIDVDSAGTFTLLGRHTDLVKIGGRRASLAGLNQLLQELPTLADGVFHLPTSDAPAERLVLIYSGEPLDRSATESWLRARVDPAFMPRAFIRVDRLPRAGGGKLPKAALDEICAAWRAEKVRDRSA